MTRVKHLIQALAAHGMETRVFMHDRDGSERPVLVCTGTNINGVLLAPALKNWRGIRLPERRKT